MSSFRKKQIAKQLNSISTFSAFIVYHILTSGKVHSFFSDAAIIAALKDIAQLPGETADIQERLLVQLQALDSSFTTVCTISYFVFHKSYSIYLI